MGTDSGCRRHRPGVRTRPAQARGVDRSPCSPAVLRVWSPV